MHPLISADDLQQRLGDPDVRVVDCRYVLGQPDGGRQLYLEEHIAGASFLDLDRDLAAPVGDGSAGRHPLPDHEQFTAAARRAGISMSSLVVAYDQNATGGAARLWWLLRHYGFDRVAVLDGGFRGWRGPTAAGEEDIARGDFAVREVRDDLATVEDVAARLRRPDRVLVDARAPERYRGEVEPIDPTPGHLPGAINAPFTQPPPPDLLADDRELIAYCGSGVTACQLVLQMAAAGRDDVRLYAGSYSEWVNRGLPVETGVPSP